MNSIGLGQTHRRLAKLALLVALVSFAAVACSNADSEATPGVLAAVDNPPPFSHIHGLGVDPTDGSFYVATHGGLHRLDKGRASIVANRYQDTMGFLVVGAKHFIASGHPDLREGLPPLLGLLESRDAGKTWVKKSLLGKADFHALRFVHGQVWAYNSSSSELMVSEDGKRWDSRSAASIRDFVVSPKSAKRVITSNGEILRTSRDGGRSWKRMDAPGEPLLLSWETADELWLVTAAGDVYRSSDAGESWKRRGAVRAQPGAFLVDGNTLYVATHDQVFTSKDGGKDWKLFFSEEA